MDPTTLVTFLFRAPKEVLTVELLGSWDNFDLPYRMHHDRLRGSGFWSGCFKFENIICDGDDFQWAKPRNGGLRQGGKYWYYYRLNYDTEAYDDRHSHTTTCPLLPGQTVNILEVPIEVVEIPERCQSAYGYGDIMGSLAKLANQHTLDPKDKYALLEPPPISKVHTRCHSDIALDGRLENQPLTVVQEPVSPVMTPVSRPARSAILHSRSSERHRQGEVSCSSSVYSQRSSQSEAISTMSRISEMSLPVMKGQRASSVQASEKLPSFPHPSGAGPAPLEAGVLKTTCFGSSETVSPTSQMRAKANHQAVQEYHTYSCSPESVQNVQFYGSRPGTSLTEDPKQYRPRMYSLPNRDVSDLDEESNPASPFSPTFISSPRCSEDLEENPTPGDGAFDLISPTFTATTISTGGHTTPFRLSAQTACEFTDIAEEESNVSDPSYSPETSRNASVTSATPSLFDRTMARLGPPSFLNYSLPRSATESNNSLAKTASNPSARAASHRQELPLPSIFREQTGGSMADDIFNELGYFSANIT